MDHPSPAAPGARLPPIAVDLDGSLLRIDTLHESLCSFAKSDPAGMAGALLRIREGKAAFKRSVAEAAELDVETLPFDEELLAWLRAEQAGGRRLGLFTAADQSVADAVAARLPGLFEVVRGSDGHLNLSGARKADAIAAEFPEGFCYVGNAAVDVPIFARAEAAILVGDVARLRGMLPPGSRVEAEFPAPAAGWAVWRKALRLSHWSKNLLVFVAPLLGFPVDRAPATLLEAVLLFVLMGMVASASYLANDLFDLSADRRHPVKRYRPLAAGLITAQQGALVSAGMLAAAFLLSLVLLPYLATLVLGVYLVTTTCYSFALKRMPIVDVITLAGLFTVRILAGSALLEERVSLWLLTFSMLFFVGLAMVKRYAELDRVVAAGGAGIDSRGYTAKDLALLLGAGLASGFSAIVIFTIYLIQEQYPREIYGTPGLLWMMVPIIMVWLLRVWHLTLHGRMNEDPVAFALTDRFSLGLGVVSAIVLVAAWG
ncbi:UbiA family prenyltransferase [Roseococcus sp. SYP-B2431]|uniref:UbiA family prenyltransferase n=1 Tax=Roseococcus sp. SYP-B2431 TaxID=2496640 RepID=UPI0013F46B5E|nr:UbiA family prenyltransferase [Roseococcus sp. SYP-B2431]